MNNDVAMVQGAVTNAVTGIVRDSLTVIFLVFVCFYMRFILAMIAMVVFPLAIYPLVSFLAGGSKDIPGACSYQWKISLNDSMRQLAGIRIVKAFAMEDYESNRFTTANEALFHAFMRRFKVRALSNSVMETLGGLGAAAMLFYGGYQVLNGALFTWDFLLFFGRSWPCCTTHKETE